MHRADGLREVGMKKNDYKPVDKAVEKLSEHLCDLVDKDALAKQIKRVASGLATLVKARPDVEVQGQEFKLVSSFIKLTRKTSGFNCGDIRANSIK